VYNTGAQQHCSQQPTVIVPLNPQETIPNVMERYSTLPMTLRPNTPAHKGQIKGSITTGEKGFD